jgi:hypothetical protein
MARRSARRISVPAHPGPPPPRHGRRAQSARTGAGLSPAEAGREADCEPAVRGDGSDQSLPVSLQIWFFLVVRALAASHVHWWTRAPAVVGERQCGGVGPARPGPHVLAGRHVPDSARPGRRNRNGSSSISPPTPANLDFDAHPRMPGAGERTPPPNGCRGALRMVLVLITCDMESDTLPAFEAARSATCSGRPRESAVRVIKGAGSRAGHLPAVRDQRRRQVHCADAVLPVLPFLRTGRPSPQLLPARPNREPHRRHWPLQALPSAAVRCLAARVRREQAPREAV